MERKGIITMKGNPLTLLGPHLEAGDKAPDFTVLDNKLNGVGLKDFAGKIKVKTFSDHRDASFGAAYGVLAKELRLLARSIFIVDKDNTIKYIEIVPEVTNHPDYDKALEMVKQLIQKM